MRYLVVRKENEDPKVYAWAGELTHLHMMKENKIKYSDASSAGYVVYDNKKQDFFITWHTPFQEEETEEQTQKDKKKVLSYMHSVYGDNEKIKKQMGAEFEAQQRRNAEIRAKYNFGGGR